MLIRLASFSENEEREDGMAGSGRACSSTFSGKAPGPKRGVSNSSEASLAAIASFEELALREEPCSAARDRIEAASSVEVCEARRRWEMDGRWVRTGHVCGGGIDKLAWSELTSVTPASAYLPLGASAAPLAGGVGGSGELLAWGALGASAGAGL